MKQFEATWMQDWKHYERYYDTELKKSVKRQIDIPYEYYEPSSTGLYTYILDESIILEKKQGNAKQARDNYGVLDPMYRNIRDNYWGKTGGFNIKPRMWYLDIETRVGTCSTGFPVPNLAIEPISMFQIYDNHEECVIMLGVRDWVHKEDYEDKFECPVKYINCKNEYDLIKTFISLFEKLDPLVLLAWNGNGFDYPYIYNRFKKLGFKQLSNYGNVSLTEREIKGRMIYSIKSNGHFFVDLMEVYQKFTFKPRPSYALDYIAEVELKENKVNHSEFVNFDDFYTGNYVIPINPNENQKNSKIYQEAIKNGITDEVRELGHSTFCYYAYKDTMLIYNIDKKLNLTTLMSMIAEKMGVQIGDALGTVKPWSQYITNRSYANGRVMPPKKQFDKPYIVGGYVRSPVVGKHKWVLSADVNSMYPLLGMVGFNMSPETFVPKSQLPAELRDVVMTYFNDQLEEKRLELPEDVWQLTEALLKKYNKALGINGAVFDKSALGMVPEMVLEIYNNRKKAKKTMLAYEDRKIMIREILKGRKDV